MGGDTEGYRRNLFIICKLQNPATQASASSERHLKSQSSPRIEDFESHPLVIVRPLSTECCWLHVDSSVEMICRKIIREYSIESGVVVGGERDVKVGQVAFNGIRRSGQ